MSNDGHGRDAWEVLHRGTGREAFDAPERFDLASVPRPNRRSAPEPRQESGPAWPREEPAPAWPREEPAPAWSHGAPAPVWSAREAGSRGLPEPASASRSPNPSDLLGEHRPDVRSEPRQPAARPESRSLVRPYARTGGRTRPAQDLQLESLVSATDHGRPHSSAVTTVQRFICDLCVDVRSIAEIAAYARLPLGVVKVIVADLADAGDVLIQPPARIAGDRTSQQFMERILDGLRAL